TTLYPGAPMNRFFSCGLLPLSWLVFPSFALAQPPPPRPDGDRVAPHEAELANLLRDLPPAHAGDDPLDAARERAKGKFALSRPRAGQVAEAGVRVARLGLALELERIRFGQRTVAGRDSIGPWVSRLLEAETDLGGGAAPPAALWENWEYAREFWKVVGAM